MPMISTLSAYLALEAEAAKVGLNEQKKKYMIAGAAGNGTILAAG
jgi:hypothetical protein